MLFPWSVCNSGFFLQQYLNHGCTQYFTTSTSEKKLNNSQKSQNHLKKGGLRDTMLDDVEDFTNMDTVSLNCN